VKNRYKVKVVREGKVSMPALYYSADSVCRRKSYKAYCFHPSLIVRALSSLSDSAVAALAVDVWLLKAGRFQLAVGESGSSPGCRATSHDLSAVCS